MKEKKTEIKKIILNIEGKEVSLTVDQAKKLKDILSDMFGKEIVKEHHHHYDRWWYQPYYVGSIPPYQITWGDTTSGSYCCANITLT